MSGKRLLQLINDVLDAAKMKQGGLIIKQEEVGSTNKQRGRRAHGPLQRPLFSSSMALHSQAPPIIPFVQVDVPRVISDVFEITKSLVGRKVQLVNLVDAIALPTITADPDRLVQILYNLIGNAGERWEFTMVLFLRWPRQGMILRKGEP